MMRTGLGIAAAMAFFAFAAANASAETVESRYKLSIGGYVKLDYINQSAKLGPLSGPVPADGTLAAEQNESLFTARQSRLNFSLKGPEFNGAKTGAFLEGDFYGPGGSNESPNFRMRHAYGFVNWENTQLLFGQFWDIFGPFVASTYDFRSGAFTGGPNNPRVPQARLTHTFKFGDTNSIRVIAGVQNPVQNFKDANSSGDMVNVAGQVMLVSKALGVSPGYFGLPMNPLTLGFFGLYGKDEVAEGGNADEHKIDVYGYGAYAFVPLLKSTDGKSKAMTLSFEGQAYVAAGLNTLGATAAATVGTATDRDAAKGYGFGGQFIFYPTQPLGIAAGYGRRHIMDRDDYTGAAEKYNEQYFANVSYDFNPAVRLAAEYQRLQTKYLAAPAAATDDRGEADRFMLSAMYFF
ncbi:MAG: hypothetical protein IH614_20355 [Desulfuromonadales bacterium]|nr:hypothetical protein [Desulfuromonadales bacterium]